MFQNYNNNSVDNFHLCLHDNYLNILNKHQIYHIQYNEIKNCLVQLGCTDIPKRDDKKHLLLQTNENGIANLNINLNVGTYIITSEHNGLKISNIITIESKSEKEIIKNNNFTYEIEIPNYVNITCPYAYENSFYTIQSGYNGIIRLEKNQLITVQIGYKNYIFSTAYMPEYGATYLGSEYYLLPFDNSPTQHSYKYEKLNGNGLILYRNSDYTHFIYRNNCSSNVEQFGAYINKRNDLL